MTLGQLPDTMTARRRIFLALALLALPAACAPAQKYDDEKFVTGNSPDGSDAVDVQDANHVPTRELFPVIAPGWLSKMDTDKAWYRQYGAMISRGMADAEARRNADGLTYIATYEDHGTSISVEAGDLLYPGYGRAAVTPRSLMTDRHHFAISGWIVPGSGVTVHLPDSGLLTDCGPGVAADAQGRPAYRLFGDRALGEKGAYDFTLVVEGDPQAVTHCTLHVAPAVSGRPVPDLPLKAKDGWHETRVFIVN